ncbi:MAG TPA: type II secretion system protein [Candidatus Limnocylindrales bacterium]|nr:type II secretion system protein [Candidatus Limnocylindrales bacterium]
MHKHYLSRSEGYSFVELLVAITILGIVVAPFIGLFATGFTAITAAGQQTTAVNLGRAKMEAVKALGYEAAYNHYITNNNPIQENEIAGFPGYHRVTTVQPHAFFLSYPNEPPRKLELLLINVTVSWTMRETEKSETLTSLLSRR